MAFRHARILFVGVVSALLVGAVPVAAAAPTNDEASGATALSAGVSVQFNSIDATETASDPTSCDGSHGSFPGPYFASVWFSYTAANRDRHLVLNAPTHAGPPGRLPRDLVRLRARRGRHPDAGRLHGVRQRRRVGCGPGTTYLIMEAGLSTAVTEEPDFSDRGGHGSIRIDRLAAADDSIYAWSDSSPTTTAGSA